MTRLSRRTAALMAAAMAVYTPTASAMTLRDFRKFTTDEQSMYIGAAVSMLAYTYGANGQVAKGRCIQNWYYGRKGVETPGPREITNRLEAYESLDPDKYHVEGVILGVTDKACRATATQATRRP